MKHTKPIPFEIDVVGFLLPVKQTTQSAITRKMGRTETGGPFFGYLEPHRRIIVREDLPEQKKWEVLIHEVGHEIQFIIADLGLGECDLAIEAVHSLYHRLLTGVLLANGLIGVA